MTNDYKFCTIRFKKKNYHGKNNSHDKWLNWNKTFWARIWMQIVIKWVNTYEFEYFWLRRRLHFKSSVVPFDHIIRSATLLVRAERSWFFLIEPKCPVYVHRSLKTWAKRGFLFKFSSSISKASIINFSGRRLRFIKLRSNKYASVKYSG